MLTVVGQMKAPTWEDRSSRQWACKFSVLLPYILRCQFGPRPLASAPRASVCVWKEPALNFPKLSSPNTSLGQDRILWSGPYLLFHLLTNKRFWKSQYGLLKARHAFWVIYTRGSLKGESDCFNRAMFHSASEWHLLLSDGHSERKDKTKWKPHPKTGSNKWRLTKMQRTNRDLLLKSGVQTPFLWLWLNTSRTEYLVKTSNLGAGEMSQCLPRRGAHLNPHYCGGRDNGAR